jgi:hypothetical protein
MAVNSISVACVATLEDGALPGRSESPVHLRQAVYKVSPEVIPELLFISCLLC